MAYTIKLKDTHTGETREVHVDKEWDLSEEFWWSDGNGSCDCAIAKEHFGIEGVPCGDSRYEVDMPPFTDAMRIAFTTGEF